MDKPELRKKHKALRLNMSAPDVADKSLVICRKLYDKVDWPKIKNLHIYKPFSRLNEVNTAELLARVRSEHPVIDIVAAGSSKNASFPNQRFDLVIVPVLAFDKDNYRLGWGGGWYDRFLAGQPQALKIGLCFQNGFVEGGLPHEPHDIALDKIVTETGL
jgi:5-formyltetrahydrofolate cyclo-ligase